MIFIINQDSRYQSIIQFTLLKKIQNIVHAYIFLIPDIYWLSASGLSLQNSNTDASQIINKLPSGPNTALVFVILFAMTKNTL